MSSNKKIKVKGSVLYTVTAVMSILTILVFAAMTLATSANRRAHNNYANNQTQFTASSVVDLVWNTISNNDTIKAKVYNLTKNASMNISVDGLDNSMGQISSASIKCIDAVSKKYKLTVTAKLLGQENTVTAYYGIDQSPERPTFLYGLRTYFNTNLDNAVVLGGTCMGVDKYTDAGSRFTNSNAKFNSPIHIKGDLHINQARSVVLNPKSGMVVQGDIFFENGSDTDIIGSNFSNYGSSNKYMDMPYIYSYMHYYDVYAGGKISYPSNPVKIGTAEKPVLVIAQNIEQSNANQQIYGDVYLAGGDRISTIGFGGVQSWNSGVIDKKMAATSDFYTGGNIYSMGTVKYDVNTDIDALANNIIADMLNFDIITGGNKKTKTTGAVVANELNINGKRINTWNNNTTIDFLDTAFEFEKGLFVDPANFNFESKATINDVKFDPNLDLNTVYTGTKTKSLNFQNEYGYTGEFWYKDGSIRPVGWDWQEVWNDYHEYKFDLDAINNTDDYILDSVRIYYNVPQNPWDPNSKQYLNDISLSAVIGGKDAADENAYAEIEQCTLGTEEQKDIYGNALKDFNGNKLYNYFIDVKYKLKTANGDNKIHLKNKDNVISFKLNKDTDANNIQVNKVDVKYKHIYTVKKNADEKAFDYSYGGKYSNSITFDYLDWWNRDGFDNNNGYVANNEYHEYNFSLPESADEQDYIIDSVRVYFDPGFNFNNNLTNVDMEAEIKGANNGNVYAMYSSNIIVKEVGNNFIDVKFSTANGSNRIYLSKGEYTIRFNLNKDTNVNTVSVPKVMINYSYCGLRAVNDKAFDDNGGLIQLDDIDKSVRLVKNGDKYYIYKAELRNAEGKEITVTDADFKQVAYNENYIRPYIGKPSDSPPEMPQKIICGSEGNLIYKQGDTKYVGEAGVTEADGWISEFTSDNYDKFLKAVVAAVSYPDSLGTYYYGLKQKAVTHNDLLPYSNADDSFILTGDPNGIVSGVNVYTNIKIGGTIAIEDVKPEMADTLDGNRVGKETNNNKVVRCEYSEDIPKSVTIYRNLHTWDWGLWDYAEIKAKIKYDNLTQTSDSNPLIRIDGVGYTCNQTDIKIYKIFVGENGREALNGVSNGLKTNPTGVQLIDDTYLMGVSGVRSEGIKEIVERVDKIFDVYNDPSKDESSKPIYKTDGKVYNFNDGSITGGNLTITESCTLTGNVPKNFEIKIDTTVNHGDIYIRLRDFNLGGANGSEKANIIVNDSDGRVNFLIPYEKGPDGKGKQISLEGNILTEEYKAQLDSAGADPVGIYANPVIHDVDKNIDYADETKIPDIYFYSEYFQKKEDRTVEGGVEKLVPCTADEEMTISLGHGSIICGYFMMASARVTAESGGNTTVAGGFEYFFDRIPMLKNVDVQNIANPTKLPIKFNNLSGDTTSNTDYTVTSVIIGAVSCSGATLSNYALVAYVNPNPVDSEGKRLSDYNSKLLYYQAY